MNRQRIIDATSCPICGAEAGQRCTKRGRPRKTVHGLRVHYATNGQKMTPFEVSQAKRKSAKSKNRKKADAKDFYASWEWKQVRYEALMIYGRQCMCCGWMPGPGKNGHLCVDHIKPRSKYPNLALNLSNLQVLCDQCNRGKSNIYETDWRSEWEGDECPDDPLTAQFKATMQ